VINRPVYGFRTGSLQAIYVGSSLVAATNSRRF